ncbi:MAG: Rrf2 family transcriptional regulator [Eggerthellaceae bacterium]|nr:Rrf2 family transcriptional regulator [Eggerthellaceae bacterium]
MLVTTKGRYALRLMLNVASHSDDGKVALRQIAEEEAISLKYLEQLAHSLVKANLLASVRGHGGGYTLTQDADTIRIGDVLRAAEGSTVPVACSGLENGCPRERVCSAISFWAGLDDVIENYVDGVTLAELLA